MRADSSVASVWSHERHRLARREVKHRVAASLAVDAHRTQAREEAQSGRRDRRVLDATSGATAATDAYSFDALHEAAGTAGGCDGSGERAADEETRDDDDEVGDAAEAAEEEARSEDDDESEAAAAA